MPEPVPIVQEPELVVSAPAFAERASDHGSPVYQQYLDVKRQFPNALVLFRLGEFYEAFDEDAQVLATTLGIVLTSRNISSDVPIARQRVKMAGIPYHSAETYIARLMNHGHHVAICDPIGDEPTGGLIPHEVVMRSSSAVVAPPAQAAEPEVYALPEALPDVYAAYLKAKREHRDALVFVQTPEGVMTFGADATTAGRELHAAITRQRLGAEWLAHTRLARDSAEERLETLVKNQHRVAVANALANGPTQVRGGPRAAPLPRGKSPHGACPAVSQRPSKRTPQPAEQLALFP